MKYFIKKLSAAITLLSITSIGGAYGADCCPSACEPDCCNPCVQGFFCADLLYWRAFERGLDTCFPTEVTDVVTSDRKVISSFTGKGRDPHFRWDPGFRIGAGFEGLGCSNRLDIDANWTHFYSHADGSKEDDNRLRWKLHFDTVDVVAGYKADLGSCIVLRPFGGLRGARIDQHVRIDHSPCSDCTSSSFRPGKDNKEKFLGIGPIIGLEGDWNLDCGFSLYASSSVSWLYGRIHLKENASSHTHHTEEFCQVRKRLDDTLTVFDAAIGIRWETCLCSSMQLIFELGLEHHTYFDYNRIGDCCGDLNFDGVTFGIGLGY